MTQGEEGIPAKLLEAMSVTAEDWEQTPQSVRKLVMTFVVRIQALETEVGRLEERVNRNSRNSSQPPSSDGPGAAKPEHVKEGRHRHKRGGQAGHPGTQRKLVAIEQVKADYDVKPITCRKCGQALSGNDPAPDRHQVTEIPPVHVEVYEYRIHTLTCSSCGAKTRAGLPTGVPQGGFGPRFQAMTALLSGRYHLSKRDTVGIMDDFFQAEVGLGSVPTLEQRTSEALAQPVAEARTYVQVQPAVHGDETGWKQGMDKAWLWVAATPCVTVFLVALHRSGEVAKQILGEKFAGILNSDRWSAYNWLDNDQRQLCWAHLLRDFQAFVERGGISQCIGEALLTQTKPMFDGWHHLREGTWSRSYFQDYMQPVRHQIADLLRQGAACDHAGTAGTCRDILKREEALFTFVDVQGVEPTNNLAERQIRPGVLWRKGSFGTQSAAGSRFVERIMTVVSTLKQQNRNVLEYLTMACDAANCGQPAPSLLPVKVRQPSTP
jgi:transposase